MAIVCSYHLKCDLPQRSKASAKINSTEICYDVWNKATDEERNWIKRATDLYNRGLTTKKEFSDSMLGICYHHIDPTAPVFL